MKVLLVTLNAKFIHSSLALSYLEKYCNSDLWEIEVKEYTINELIDDILADIHRAKPDILCFSCYIWNIEPILQLCQDFKSINPHIPIILGGPEVSYDANQYIINYPIDFVIRGEGEETLKELLTTIVLELDYANVEGITYKEGKLVRENKDRSLIKDLDTIPFPYQDNLFRYKNKTIYYEASRGCPFNCSYCLSSTIKGVRFFSLARVKHDLNYLMNNKVKEVKFVDRTFNCNEKRAIEIMEYIIANNINTKFHFEIGAELISSQFIEFLKDVPKNMFDFEIGIQSTFPLALKAVNRPANWEVISENISKLVSLENIHIHLDLIAGLPYEDYNKFATSFNNVYNLKPDKIQLGFLKLLKGSTIRNEANKYDYIQQAKPPYQVLANHVLTYDELINLNQIEKLVEKYYNTHIVDETLDFLINEVFSGDSFNFFASFANYWDKDGLFYMGHKREREYTILMEYVLANYPNYQEIINETLKFDYFTNNKSYQAPDKIYTNNKMNTNNLLNDLLKDEKFVAQNIPHLHGKTVREMKKQLHLEYFNLNPLTDYNNSGLLLFVYISPKTTKVLDVTLYTDFITT